MKFQICADTLTPQTCPVLGRGGEQATCSQMKSQLKRLLCILSHSLPLQHPSWESHRHFHQLKRSRRIRREDGCELFPLPLSHLPGGDTSQQGMQDLPTALPCGPGTDRQEGPSPPPLSSHEYPRRCSPFLLGILSPLCRSTVLCIGLHGTCGLQGLPFSPVTWVEGMLPHLGSHRLPSHPHLPLTILTV